MEYNNGNDAVLTGGSDAINHVTGDKKRESVKRVALWARVIYWAIGGKCAVLIWEVSGKN